MSARAPRSLMDLRIKGLSHLDPLTVPLPNGTEVVTCVDRLLGERRIPEGAVGRVVAQHGGEFDVQIVGIGVARYSRDELVPRKVGQVRFARRREAVWSALRPYSVLETPVGSHAWGVADEARTPMCPGCLHFRSHGLSGSRSRLSTSSAPMAAPRSGRSARPSVRRCAPIRIAMTWKRGLFRSGSRSLRKRKKPECHRCSPAV